MRTVQTKWVGVPPEGVELPSGVEKNPEWSSKFGGFTREQARECLTRYYGADWELQEQRTLETDWQPVGQMSEKGGNLDHERHMLTENEKQIRDWLRDKGEFGNWVWMVIKAGFRRSYFLGREDGLSTAWSSPEAREVFRKAWHEADERGEEGSRVAAGLEAVAEYLRAQR